MKAIAALTAKSLGLLRNFWGGGASYVIIGLTALALYQHVRIGDIKADRTELKDDLKSARADTRGTAAVTVTHGAQTTREKSLDESQKDANKKIDTTPDSTHCADSEPLRAGFDWMRDFDAANPAHVENDADNVSMPEPAGR